MGSEDGTKRSAQSRGPRELAMQFVAAVNQRQLDRMTALMHPEHVFVDTLGARINGRMATRMAWEGFYRKVPDYAIDVSDVFEDGTTAVLIGTAGGTYSPQGCRVPGNRWSAPAAWKAIVEDGRIRRWQIFADIEPLREKIRLQSAED